jgi:oxygen-independent coproporphyrinogen-3 oxidase
VTDAASALNPQGHPPDLPLGLYVHLPWCVQKCPYCDFNSHALRSELPETDYVNALLRDADFEAERAPGRRIASVFIGGGTPSLFSPRAVARLLDGLDRRLGFAADAEITLEANPGTVERERFVGFRAAGVTRLSIGVQSFHDAHLHRLGRIHDGAAAAEAARAARAAGFDRFNLDLMVGLPQQTLVEADADLRQALDLGARHVSHYQLTLEPGTAFHARPPSLPDDELIAAMQASAADTLAAAGLARYEVSAWAEPGQECLHNLNYWRFGDYLAVGAGGHGKITEGADITRYSKVRLPRRFMAVAGSAEARAEHHRVPRAERPLEFMMNALRLPDGVPARWMTERTGCSLDDFRPALDAATERGWLEHGDRLRPTATGLLFLNDLLALFLPEECA